MVAYLRSSSCLSANTTFMVDVFLDHTPCSRVLFAAVYVSSYHLWLVLVFSFKLVCSLDCIVFADCFLQRTTLFSSLFFYILDCIIFVSFWNSLDCNKVFCMVFISSWGDIYVMFNLIPAHFIVLSRVLRTVVKRSGLQFNTFLSSLSMVRGHKAQALWPMASPLNLLSGQHFSCIVQHMVWNILFLYGGRSWCLFSFLSPLNFAIRISMELMQFRGLLIFSRLKNMLLNDSFGSLGTIFEKFHHIF